MKLPSESCIFLGQFITESFHSGACRGLIFLGFAFFGDFLGIAPWDENHLKKPSFGRISLNSQARNKQIQVYHISLAANVWEDSNLHERFILFNGESEVRKNRLQFHAEYGHIIAVARHFSMFNSAGKRPTPQCHSFQEIKPCEGGYYLSFFLKNLPS